MRGRFSPRALSGATRPYVSDVNTNHWRTLYYHDPAHVLRRLRATERELADALREADNKVRCFRTMELNQYREWRDAWANPEGTFFLFPGGWRQENPELARGANSAHGLAPWVQGRHTGSYHREGSRVPRLPTRRPGFSSPHHSLGSARHGLAARLR